MAARATADLSRGIVPEALLVNPKVLQHPGFLKKLATHTP
jgi:hypothetical protein